VTVTKHKAFAYITSGTTSGTRLLLLAHPNQPEAGLQVPAGTMEAGETPEQAVLREAREETDLEHLILVELIGRQTYDARPWGGDELHDRWFFHLRCEQTTAERWRTTEESPSDGGGPVAFELFWVPLDQTFPALIADHDRFIPELVEMLQKHRDP
jgi:8-oxo-dGTP diphosphatase